MKKERMKPRNGLYLTAEDSPEFHDVAASLYPGQNVNVQNVTFLVTERCNLACTYCYEVRKTGRRMTWETAKQGVDLLFDRDKLNGYFDFANTKGIILDFIGGEPLLEIGLIDKICDYFSYKCYRENPPWGHTYMFSMSSNGILYDTPAVQSYLQRHAGKVSMGISLDGDRALHDRCRVFPDGTGSYDIAARSAKLLLKNNPYASTKVTFAPENIANLFQAVKSLREDLGYVFVHANCVFEEGWTREHGEIFESQLRLLADYILDNRLYDRFCISLFDEHIGKPEGDLDQNWCGGNGRMLAIGTDGTCYPCVRFAPLSLSSGREPLVVGDVQKGLMQGESQCRVCQALKGITLRSQSTEECIHCPIRSGCALCTGYNYDRFGDPNRRATFICEMHRARVRANQYYWTRLREELGICS